MTAASTTSFNSAVGTRRFAFVVDLEREVEDLVGALAGEGAREEERDVAQRAALLHLALEVARGVGLLVDEVPFVDHDDQALLHVRGLAEHLGVLRLEAALGVHEEHGHVAALDRALRAQHGVELDVLLHAGLLAQPGRIDQDDLATV